MKKSKHPTSNIQQKDDPTLLFVLSEADELVRIFFSSVQTAKRNALAEQRPSSKPLRNSPTQAP